MRKHLSSKRLSRRIFSLLISLLFLFCLQKYENPISSNYNGDYGYNAQWASVDSICELFKEYQFTVLDTGEDKFWEFELSTSPKVPLSFNLTRNGDTIVLKYTFDSILDNGQLLLKGIRPNRIIDMVSRNIHIVNPYSIDGPAIAGIGDSVRFTVIKNKPQDQVHIDSVQWYTAKEENGAKQPFSKNELSFFSDNDNHLEIAAVISRKDKRFILTRTLDIEGYSPAIGEFTIADTLKVGEVAVFNVAYTDNDSDSVKFIISADGKKLLEDSVFRSAGNMITLTSDTIEDTAYAAISITAVDKRGHRSNTVSIADPLVKVTYPGVRFIPDDCCLEVATNDTTIRLSVAADEEIVEYQWKIKDVNTSTGKIPYVILKPYSDSTVDTVIVLGKNRYGIIGRDTLVVTARPFKYKIVNQFTMKDTVKARTWDTLSFLVESTIDPVDESDQIEYLWDFGDTTQIDTIRISKSKIAIKFEDSIPDYSYSVKAVINKQDTTPSFVKTIVIRTFRPSFRFEKDSLAVNRNEKTFLPYTASDPDSGKCRVYFRSDMQETEDTIRFMRAGTYKVYGYAMDIDSFKSKIDSMIVVVNSNEPNFIDTLVSDTAFVGKEFVFSSKVTEGTKLNVSNYVWDINNDNVWDTTTKVDSIKKNYTNTGVDTIRVGIKSDISGDSILDTMKFLITILENRPIIKACSLSTRSTYINDSVKIFIQAAGPDENLESLFLTEGGNRKAFKDVNSIVVNTSFSVRYTIADTGEHRYIIECHAVNKSVTISDTLKVTVLQGMPEIVSVKPDTVFINDLTQYLVNAQDNDTSLKYRWSSELALLEQKSWQLKNQFNYSLNDSGWHYLYVQVMDPDSQQVVVKDSVFVKAGAPKIISVKVDSSTLYVKREYDFTLKVHDTNGTVNKCYVNWTGDTTRSDTLTKSDSVTFTGKHTFDINTYGQKKLNFWAEDDDGVLSERKDLLITVHQCPPVLKGVDKNTVWANDDTTFQFSVFDTNGTVDTVYIDWTDGKKDTLKLKSNPADSIKHKFAIKDDTTYAIQIRMVDNDGVKSSTEFPITVKRGAPSILINNDDTLFIKTTTGGGVIDIPIQSEDPNGSIVKYYFDFTAQNGLDTNVDNSWKKDSSIYRGFIIPNTDPFKMAVFAKDEDGNVGGSKFYLYPDEPPPTPATLTFFILQSNDSVQLAWTKVLDKHDSLNTQIKIMVKYGDVGEPDQTLVQYKPASSFNTRNIAGTEYYTYTFPITQRGSVRWRVYLKDRSGNEVLAPAAGPSSFAIP